MYGLDKGMPEKHLVPGCKTLSVIYIHKILMRQVYHSHSTH